MMHSAEGYSEFIANFETNCPWLCKAQVMRIGWLPPTHQTWLRSHEFQVSLIAQALGFGDGELAFVNFSWAQFGYGRRQGRCHRFCCICLITTEEFSHGPLMSLSVVMRRSGDWCRVVR